MLCDVTTPQDLDDRFRETLAALPAAQRRRDPADPVIDDAPLTGARLLDLFDAQVTSRHLDLAAPLAAQLRRGLLHDRLGRPRGQRGGRRRAAPHRPGAAALPLRRVLLRPGGPGRPTAARRRSATCCAGWSPPATEPIAGGRHKVFGRADLAIVPTTSTIASHLPRAVGLGLAVERLRRLDTAGRRTGRRGSSGAAPHRPWPPDAIVVCSFGDASVNHASATAAFNTAGWYDHAGLRMPVLFVCEDNGLGISVRSPEGWVAATLRARPGHPLLQPPTAPTWSQTYDGGGGGRGLGAPAPPPGRAAPAHGPADGPRRGGRRVGVPQPRRDRRRPGPGPGGRAPPGCSSTPAWPTGEELLARYDEIGWQVRRVAEEVLGEPKLASPPPRWWPRWPPPAGAGGPGGGRGGGAGRRAGRGRPGRRRSAASCRSRPAR